MFLFFFRKVPHDNGKSFPDHVDGGDPPGQAGGEGLALPDPDHQPVQERGGRDRPWSQIGAGIQYKQDKLCFLKKVTQIKKMYFCCSGQKLLLRHLQGQPE